MNKVRSYTTYPNGRTNSITVTDFHANLDDAKTFARGIIDKDPAMISYFRHDDYANKQVAFVSFAQLQDDGSFLHLGSISGQIA